MNVEVVCFGAMRDYLPGPAGNRTRLDVPDGATVRDLIEALGAPVRLVFSVLVDGQQAGLDETVHEGAEVTLMPPFAGGID